MKRLSFAITAVALSSSMLSACGGAAAPAAAPVASPAAQAAPADQAANGAAPAGAPGTPGAPGQGFPRGGFANMKRAAELPADNPVVSGPIISHSGNTLMVRVGFGRRGQGQGQATPVPGPTATLAPPIAVEIDASTKIYSDTTVFDPAAAQDGQQVQQTVKLISSLDELNIPANANSAGAGAGAGNGGPGGPGGSGFVQVWGDTSTGKLVATVILYSRPRGRPGPQSTPTP